MAQNKFKGLGIALITPFKSDGEVDYEALTRLVSDTEWRGFPVYYGNDGRNTLPLG